MGRNDGRTEGRNDGMTDKANTKCPLTKLPFYGGGIKINVLAFCTSWSGFKASVSLIFYIVTSRLVKPAVIKEVDRVHDQKAKGLTPAVGKPCLGILLMVRRIKIQSGITVFMLG